MCVYTNTHATGSISPETEIDTEKQIKVYKKNEGKCKEKQR